MPQTDKQMFKIGVWYDLNGYVLIEANTVDEAEQTVKEMLEEEGTKAITKVYNRDFVTAGAV